MRIVIDDHSGFCFGVINAIQTAENYLAENQTLYCLGDIVHNNEEVARLSELGLVVISHEYFRKLHNATVMIRAHGEPPDTYRLAEENNLTLIDATCSVVLALQKRIREAYKNMQESNGKVLIYGKKGHAEVVGLQGQTAQEALVISSLADIDKIDYTKPAILFSQTTQSVQDYTALVEEIRKRYRISENEHLFTSCDTICKSVANRAKQIAEFAKQFDKLVFVSGEKSSNGLYLYEICRKNNPNTYFISQVSQVAHLPIQENDNVGICGATSTPMWLMKEVAEALVRK